jgi:hypothetical protein
LACFLWSVGAFHSAPGAIESMLKNVSPNAHWIERRLATAGGKHIKMRLLSTVVTSRYYVYNKTTANLCVQRSPTSERSDYEYLVSYWLQLPTQWTQRSSQSSVSTWPASGQFQQHATPPWPDSCTAISGSARMSSSTRTQRAGLWSPLQQPLPGFVMEREDTATSRGQKAHHRVS